MNKIEKLKNDKGEWFSTREAIGNELCSNLGSIWTSDTTNDLNIIKDFINSSISTDDNLKLIDIPSSEEVKNALS